MKFLPLLVLVGQPVSFVAQNLIFCPLASRKTTSVATACIIALPKVKLVWWSEEEVLRLVLDTDA
jgi:hypothetical protein